MVKVPVLVPIAVGLKVTLRVQLALAATNEPQVLVSEKLPLTLMLVIVRLAFPVFLSVTLCALLLVPSFCAGKVKEVGERVTTGAVPVPVRLTVWAVGLALSVMVTTPVLVPAAVGLKVTLSVQLPLTATLDLHVFVWEKSPLTVMLVMLRVALPVFLSVTL
jgi:hypothetical protein